MKKSIGAKPMPFPAPVYVVGTYDPEGRPNVMTASWAGICCSNPPCVSVALRKATYTHGNLVARRAFTISVPPAAKAKEADYIGIASGRDTDKFADTGLTPVRSDLVDAPYVAEFPVVFECRIEHVLELGSHTQFVGEILDIKVDADALGADGRPAIDGLEVFVLMDGYRAVGERIGKAFSIGKSLHG